MIFDKETSKKHVKSTTNFKSSLIKISKNISISVVLITILSGCNKTSINKSYYSNNKYMNKEKIEEYNTINENDDNFKNLYNNGYLLIKKSDNEKYICYTLNNLILINNDGYHLVDMKSKMKDIFTGEYIEIPNPNSIIQFKKTDVFYRIYSTNKNNLVYKNNATYIVIDYSNLKSNIENINNNITEIESLSIKK